MAWRKTYRSTCIVCDRPRGEHELFSSRGKCPSCGDGHMVANAHQLRAHDGPWFQHWRRRSLLALGVRLDDDRDDPQTEP